MGKGPENKAQLFHDDEEEPTTAAVISINKEYASRFEHNKKREEMHRLQEKYPEQAARWERKDLGVISDKKEAQILQVLEKIKKKDPSVFDPETKFFSDSESEDQDDNAEASKKERPMLLKDLIFKQAMEGEVGTSSDEEGQDVKRPPTYIEEQQQAKSAFLKAFNEVDEDLNETDFVARQRAASKDSGAPAAGPSTVAEDSSAVQKALDSYFGPDSALEQEGDRFLKQYILNQGWVERDGEASSGDEAEEGAPGDTYPDYDEDEAYLAQAEQYEHSYNFRFEEPGGAQIATHPRSIEGTVRKEDDRRRRARKEKAARKAAEEEERAAELRQLKNLKMEEVTEKLKEVQAIAGGAGRDAPPELLAALADEEFDPEAYDRHMAAAYGDDYYEAEEEDPEALEEEYERQLEALAYGSDDDEAGDGTEAADGQADGAGETGFRALHRALAEVVPGAPDGEEAARVAREEVKRLLEEYYKLDYEGMAGGIKTRFRYKQVEPQAYGLSAGDVLALDEKELNKVVGLKMLAPYREGIKKFRPNYEAINTLKKTAVQEGDKKRRKPKIANNKKVKSEAWGSAAASGANSFPVVPRAPARTAEQERAATYAAPTLKRKREDQVTPTRATKPVVKKKTATPKGQPAQAAQPVPDGLTKAQRKNFKRSLKRAKKAEQLKIQQ